MDELVQWDGLPGSVRPPDARTPIEDELVPVEDEVPVEAVAAQYAHIYEERSDGTYLMDGEPVSEAVYRASLARQVTESEVLAAQVAASMAASGQEDRP